MTEISLFEYESHQVRTVARDGEPWFVTADLLAVLDLNRSSAALLDEDERGVHTVDTPGGDQQVSVVSEPGLYSLILRSRKPEAKAFKRWVTHEVLPTIRKSGQYYIPQTYAEALELAAGQTRKLEAAQQQISQLEPVAHSWETLADASGDYSLREAAQILDRDPAISTGQNRLSKHLREIGWTDRKGTPYQQHVDAGRLALRTTSYPHPHTGVDQVTRQIRITIKGLHALHKRMGGQGPLLLAA